ncbi:MAG TPA: EthD family reductase [Candidatus Binataceae bacterium]
MIHYHYFITHKPSISLEEFFRYWNQKHPLAAPRHQLTRRYIQSHRVHALDGTAGFDCVAEVWWDNQEAMIEVGRATGRQFRADEPNFIDMTRVESLATTDTVIKEQPAPGGSVKGIFIVKRRAGLTLPSFRKQWREVHAPAVLKAPGIRGLVQSLTLDAAYTWAEPRWDGVAHVWFDDEAAAQKAMTSPEMKAAAEDGLVGSAAAFFARENLVWS